MNFENSVSYNVWLLVRTLYFFRRLSNETEPNILTIILGENRFANREVYKCDVTCGRIISPALAIGDNLPYRNKD